MGIPLLLPVGEPARRAGASPSPAARSSSTRRRRRCASTRRACRCTGCLAAAAGWQVERHEPTADGAVLAARFDFAAHAGLMAAFPFAHELLLEATLAGRC